MTLIDDALLKAFGQSRKPNPSAAQQGPHFGAGQAGPPSQAGSRELYLRPDGSHARPETGDGTSSPNRIDPPESDADRVATHYARRPNGRSKWMELFRHEVTTDNPDLDDWLPVTDPPVGSMTNALQHRALTANVAGVMEVTDGQRQTPSPETPSSPTVVVASQAREDREANSSPPDEPPSGEAGRPVKDPADSAGDDVATPLEQPPATDQETCDFASDVAQSQFTPGWEVDRFTLPDVCQQIEAELGERIRDAALEIAEVHDRRRPVVMVGSWTRGEGRTTVTIVLARALANAGYRVAVVDADEVNPNLARALGVSTDAFQELPTTSPLSEHCIHSIDDGFTLVPFIQIEEDERGLTRRVEDIVDQLREVYDLILVDQPAGRSDLGGSSVGLYLVVRGNWVDRIEQHRGVPVSLIDNFVATQDDA